MRKLKVVKVEQHALTFENDVILYADHQSDCCESHDLDFSDLTIKDFEGLEFDLDGDFFRRIDGYGIELIPIYGWSVKVPGYGYNNGYYSDELELIIKDDNGFERKFDITECQDIQG